MGRQRPHCGKGEKTKRESGSEQPLSRFLPHGFALIRKKVKTGPSVRYGDRDIDRQGIIGEVAQTLAAGDEHGVGGSETSPATGYIESGVDRHLCDAARIGKRIVAHGIEQMLHLFYFTIRLRQENCTFHRFRAFQGDVEAVDIDLPGRLLEVEDAYFF